MLELLLASSEKPFIVSRIAQTAWVHVSTAADANEHARKASGLGCPLAEVSFFVINELQLVSYAVSSVEMSMHTIKMVMFELNSGLIGMN